MEHFKWLLYGFFAEDVWKLGIYFHIEEDFLTLHILCTHLDGRSRVDAFKATPHTLLKLSIVLALVCFTFVFRCLHLTLGVPDWLGVKSLIGLQWYLRLQDW